MSRYLAPITLLLAMLLWSSAYIVMKVAFRELDPMVVMLARMLVASLVMGLAWRWLGRFEYRRGDWRPLLVLVLAEPCFYFLFEAWALQYTSAQQAGMVLALMPLLVSVAAWYWLREALSRRALAGFALAIIGALWLSLAGESGAQAPDPLLGNFLEFCAVCCAVVYILTVRQLSARYSAGILTALQCFAGSLFFFPMLALPQVELPQQWSAMSVAAILWLGIAVNIGAYGLYNFAIGYVTASQSATFLNLIPVFTLVLAGWLLEEQLNLQQMQACILVMGGILLTQWGSRSRQQSGTMGSQTENEGVAEKTCDA